MPGTTTNALLRYPVASDAPDGAGAFFNLAQDVDDRFARASIATAGTFVGQRAYVGALEYRWNGSGWDLLPGLAMQSHARWMSATDQTMGTNGWTPIQFDTWVSDPQNMKPSSGATNFTIPKQGRWALWMRAAVTNDELSTFYVLGFYNVSASSFMSQRGQVGIKSNVPMEHYTEEVLGQGVQFQASIFRPSTGAQWISHGSGQIQCAPQMVARYLGPA